MPIFNTASPNFHSGTQQFLLLSSARLCLGMPMVEVCC
jgi:hypothetical protein